ncbi:MULTISPECIES: hypothetical protein [Variovorax]|uniref:Uncharacterized protein n=1 Tax=Variovorax boronicumulans TaxID=436515 RepID=A0A1E7U2L5_9BURK|nr:MULTISPECIES: hypothetical protein [Variovorax]ATA56064.1 hypothetical protein CKY39_24575 [Variovorax boronicumulans]OEZ30344.1 hypothetical protein AO062_12600 [Variovorax boronicumulans]PBI82901.1 elongation factor G [Variovorax boronicumulans]TSD59498.1 hypothetical protein FFI97_003965 [Variovorax sp. KBS0712]GER09588.1 hypothetical protein VHAB30_07400 [Variovorax boronicumulans]
MFAEDPLTKYPLRQSLLPGAEGLAVFAQRGPVDWLSRPDQYVFICEGRGGRIYAANEAALEEAQQLIRDAHGDQVVSREPEIHTFVDPALDAVVEPIMFLRLKSPRAYATVLRDELDRRRADVKEEDLQRHDVVIRAEVRLADLMGYAKSALAMSNGSAVIWNWLLRYGMA